MGYFKQAVTAAEEIIVDDEQLLVDAIDYVEDFQPTAGMSPVEVAAALSEHHPKGAIGFLFDMLMLDIGIWDDEETNDG